VVGGVIHVYVHVYDVARYDDPIAVGVRVSVMFSLFCLFVNNPPQIDAHYFNNRLRRYL